MPQTGAGSGPSVAVHLDTVRQEQTVAGTCLVRDYCCRPAGAKAFQWSRWSPQCGCVRTLLLLALIGVGYLWLDGASSLEEALLRSLSAKKKPYVADEANGSADRELS